MRDSKVVPIAISGAIVRSDATRTKPLAAETFNKFHLPEHRRAIIRCFEDLGDEPQHIARKLARGNPSRGPVPAKTLAGVHEQIRAELRALRQLVRELTDGPVPPATMRRAA